MLLVLVLGQLVQSPGRTTFDTKLDLVVDPGRLLTNALHLWNPAPSFGELQNQAYGYLFPQGAWFAVTDAVGLAAWVAQRLWSALVLVLAFEGARRVGRALAPRWSPWLHLVAGLAYALAPRTLGLSGVLSAEALPATVLPWMVLPLVHVVAGRWGPVRGAVLSGAAFLFVGGVNATAAVAILPLPALVIASAGSPVPRLRLALAWTAAVLAASLWWVAPLVVLGRYSPAFLDVIETARATTASLGWANVLRGQDHWLFTSVVDGRPWWQGPNRLATEPWLVASATLVAGASLVGLVHRRMPARLPLLAAVLLGMVLLTVGHASLVGSPLAGPVRDLLDGPLAPLRNVHKVDPVVRLPLALGFAHLVGLLATRVRRATGVRRALTGALAATTVVGLVVTAGPLLTGGLRQPGWDTIPRAWTAAADHLAAGAVGDAVDGRTWVVPGSGFGRQGWGWTIDEPIQPLASTPWVTRSQVPLVPPQTMRYLDALESRVTDGRGSPGLADALARAGIASVLVRHDLDVGPTASVPAARAVRALENSPGLTRERTFTGDDGVRLDLYRVDRDVPRITVDAESSVTRVVGGPEDVVALQDTGAGAGTTELVPSSTADPDVLTDGPQRRERQFGRTLDAVGSLLTADEPFRTQRRVHDHAGAPGVALVTGRSVDGATVTSSSSSGSADTVGSVRPELGPWAAVDGSTATTWRSGALTAPRGQWLEVALAGPRPLDHVDVVAGVDGFSGVPVRRVRVDTGRQSVERAVDPATGFARIRLSGEPVDRVRVTVTDVSGQVARGVVALREVTVPGVDLTREAVVPGAGAGPGTTMVFRADVGRRACTRASEPTGPLRCDPALARQGEEAGGLRRAVRTAEGGVWDVRGTVVAAAAPATGVLLDPLGAAVTVRATSVLADDPLVAAAWAHDGDPATWWSSAPGDPSPAVTLTWPESRRVSEITVAQPDAGTRRPSLVRIEAGDTVREARLDADGRARFAPVTTTSIRVTFVLGLQRPDEEALPLSVSELGVAGLQDLRHRPDPRATTGSPCGLGPVVRVDGQQLATRVTGTVADVLHGRPLDLVPCGRLGSLAPGDHHVAAISTAQFAVASLTLAPEDAVAARPASGRTATVARWDRDRRSVAIGPGDAAVLRVPENANPGWRATLDGRVLPSVAVDGWQQGYRVPAGAGGTVELEFAPDRTYRSGLAAGGAVALVLLLAAGAALATSRRARVPRDPAWRTLHQGRRTPVVLTVAGALLGGAVVAGGVLVGTLLLRRGRPLVPVLAVVLVLTTAAATATALLGRAVSPGPTDVPAAFAAGLVAAALPLVAARRNPSPDPGATPAARRRTPTEETR